MGAARRKTCVRGAGPATAMCRGQGALDCQCILNTERCNWRAVASSPAQAVGAQPRRMRYDALRGLWDNQLVPGGHMVAYECCIQDDATCDRRLGGDPVQEQAPPNKWWPCEVPQAVGGTCFIFRGPRWHRPLRCADVLSERVERGASGMARHLTVPVSQVTGEDPGMRGASVCGAD